MFFQPEMITPPSSPRVFEPYCLEWQYFIFEALQELIKIQELNPDEIEVVLDLAIFDEESQLGGVPRSKPLHELRRARRTNNLLVSLQEKNYHCANSHTLNEVKDYKDFSGQRFKTWIVEIYANHPPIRQALEDGRQRLLSRLAEEIQLMSLNEEIQQVYLCSR